MIAFLFVVQPLFSCKFEIAYQMHHFSFSSCPGCRYVEAWAEKFTFCFFSSLFFTPILGLEWRQADYEVSVSYRGGAAGE